MYQMMKFVILGLFVCNATVSAAPDAFKPVLPLSTNWRAIPTPNFKNDRDLLQSKTTQGKLQIQYKESLAKISKKQTPAEQTAELSNLIQIGSKLGPQTKLSAELTAARISAGLSASGSKQGKENGNWRKYLLSACNTAAKINDKTHEQTAMIALSIWRRIDGANAPWSSPPIDVKAQKKFGFFKAITERLALQEWSKGQDGAAFSKYRGLSAALNGTPDGAAIDLRLLELEKSIYTKQKNIHRWQKALIETATKYQSKEFLGTGNEAKVERITSTVAMLHKSLMTNLIQDSLQKKSTVDSRKQTLGAIETYLTTQIDVVEKERVRNAMGEIQFLNNDHKTASATFSALASENQGAKSTVYWRKAIRSQTIVAGWPVDAPWLGLPKGDLEPRESLTDMYRKIDAGTAGDWGTAAHIGLLMIANVKADDAFKFWMERLTKFPGGAHASRAAGWMTASRIQSKQWAELESIGRIVVQSNITGIYLKTSFKPKDVLGLALLEGGIEAYAANDFKKSILKLEEFIKSWRGHPRHDEGMYYLGLAYHGNKQYRVAVLQFENFTKMYAKSKWRRDALIKGGDWTIDLTWDDHVMYFLEAHAKEFPKEEQSLLSLRYLTNLYLGREIFDSAIRVMSIQIGRSDIDADMRVSTARRMLDVAERNGSKDTAVKLSDKLANLYKNDLAIQALALSLKSRIYASKSQISALQNLERISSKFDLSQPEIADVVSEIKFRLADTSSKNAFKDEVFSLGSKDPKKELERGYSEFSRIDKLYKSSCLVVRTSWCGPALFRAARTGELFVKAYQDLGIAKTLEPELVKSFYNRKKSIIDSVDNLSIQADEKSLEQAKSGATNPDWTSAIMWQNEVEWNNEKYTGENANHFIQYHAR